MSLLRLREIQLAYGTHIIFDQLNLVLEKGERVALIGRNGTGKSTLLQLLNGDIQVDGGEYEKQPGVTVARLVQEVPVGLEGSLFDVVARGLGEAGELLKRHHDAVHRLTEGDEGAMDELGHIQSQLEAVDGWQFNQRVETVLSRLKLDPDQAFESLSGGMKRRVLLAQALVTQPDVLLLDEPTNHLDIEAIQWLEEFLDQYEGTLVFITHDRAFLRRLATRIIELDRGHLTSWPGNYQKYIEGKQAMLEAEERAHAEFDKKLAREEAWIRQGIKARRTRNEGRVRALHKLREERKQRRQRMGQANLTMSQSERSGKIVIEAEHLHYQWGETPIVRDFSTRILRGDRVGIIGANGSGKSTLLRLLLGKLEPDSGSVKLGSQLDVAYFDQLRDTLDLDKTVADNIGEGRDMLPLADGPRHVLSYLQDFLFPPERARQPVRVLSGGERNRLLLAKLFTKPFNLLVLDEPTNDLDAETLELLEERLTEFKGTLLLVSHDREFLDNVVTSTLVFEGGTVNEYVGGYSDWLAQRATRDERKSEKSRQEKRKTGGKLTQSNPAPKGKKLSYKDQRELDLLPATIEKLEGELEAIHQTMADPDFYKGEAANIAETTGRLEKIEAELAEAYQRWENLESDT